MTEPEHKPEPETESKDDGKYQASGHLNHLEQKEHDQNLDSFLIQSQNTNQSQSQNTNQNLKQSTYWFWKE